MNDYIIFIKQLTESNSKEQFIENIKNEIKIYNRSLEIAKKINLENPILKSYLEDNRFINEPDFLFYKGSKVLSQQKGYLEELLKETDNFTLNYNPILEQASKPTLVTKSANSPMAIAFALGLFVSFVFIFIRSIFAS